MAGSIVEDDLTIEGNVKSSEGSVEVKGKVIGDLTAAMVTVYADGFIDGELSAREVDIKGELRGGIRCGDLRLGSSSVVKADISARSMSTESGARVEGRVKISGKS